MVKFNNTPNRLEITQQCRQIQQGWSEPQRQRRLRPRPLPVWLSATGNWVDASTVGQLEMRNTINILSLQSAKV